MKPPTHDSPRARAARALSPGYSYCLRCGMPWSRVKGHTTRYQGDGHGGGHRGCFPLCEDCWALLGHPEARIEYYAALIDEWAEHKPVDETVRSAIGRAVANEGVR